VWKNTICDLNFSRFQILIFVLVLLSCKRGTVNNDDKNLEKVVQTETSDIELSKDAIKDLTVSENKTQRPFRIDEFIRFGDNGNDTTYLIIDKAKSGKISSKALDYSDIMTLDFASCNIDYIGIELDKFIKLENVIGYNNNLSLIPNSFCELKKLKQVNLDANRINEIPNCLTEIDELEVLFFAENRISKIPNDIGKLSNLREIQLNGNKIKELPSSFYDLKNLTYCHLSDNMIKDINERILEMEKLETLNLINNPLNEDSKILLGKLKEIRPDIKLKF
jgi:Leucine-rich repeat (LRR) protein